MAVAAERLKPKKVLPSMRYMSTAAENVWVEAWVATPSSSSYKLSVSSDRFDMCFLVVVAIAGMEHKPSKARTIALAVTESASIVAIHSNDFPRELNEQVVNNHRFKLEDVPY